MLKVNDALWVNNGFTSCVAFDPKAHCHGDEQLLCKYKSSICVKASLTFKCMTEHLFADFSYSIALDTYL